VEASLEHALDAGRRSQRYDPNYKWVALSNTTLGVLMSAIDGSIVLISLPAIFNGIKLDPLDPGSTSYLMWIMMGYLLVVAVLVVAFGRLGDMLGGSVCTTRASSSSPLDRCFSR
jgi:MFS family permease